MNVQHAYNQWAAQYDFNENKTRDLEGVALRRLLQGQRFKHCLEIGCGTGKNTAWLVTVAENVTAVDFSEAMLARAREKLQGRPVRFQQADINSEWQLADGPFDLITFSLVLEHIEHLGAIFSKAAAVSAAGTVAYVGELHPFKQYMGSKARFGTANGEQTVTCYQHHISDFTTAAQASGFSIQHIAEWFDEDATTPPRILSLMFRFGTQPPAV